MDMIFIEILQLNWYAVPELPLSRNPLHNCIQWDPTKTLFYHFFVNIKKNTWKLSHVIAVSKESLKFTRTWWKYATIINSSTASVLFLKHVSRNSLHDLPSTVTVYVHLIRLLCKNMNHSCKNNENSNIIPQIKLQFHIR